ncbi:MAG: energy-coupling factor transporter transmembrane component T family protein, partial [Desulfohalobiaceae bacterium]
ENIPRTLANSAHEYGPNFLDKGKLAAVLSFRHLAGSKGEEMLSDESVIDMMDEGDDSYSANTIKFQAKAPNQLITQGLGALCTMQIGDESYDIEQEYLRLRRAMKTRAFRPRTNLHTYRSYGHLLGMLFVRSFDRAERVHQAMRCRGFKGRFYSLTEFSLTSRDVVFGLACMVLTATLIVFELWRRSSHV